MSLSVTKRRDACIQLLRNEFDIEGTVKWAVREYADDPAMARATNKERLARNIITIGGSGDQQALNMVAFQQALAIHAAEQNRRAISRQEAEVERLAQKLEQAEARANEVERDYRVQVQMVQDLRERLTESEVSMARLPQPNTESVA